MQRTAALLLLLSLAEAAASQIVINEAGIAPTGGAGSQFTELFNRGGCAVDLSCYTLLFSGTSGSGNATGWTVKIPSGKSIAAGGYFLIGGTAGSAGVSGGTGYPTGGAVNPFTGTADVDMGTQQMTANAVYMKQFLAAGSFPNTKGQLSLLDATGNPVASVSYNNGNNAGSYPLSAYTACNASGNAQGVNNVPDPGASAANVNATFTAATVQGIYLSGSGTYLTETSLTPRASNTGNGGTELCSGPLLNGVNNVAVCFSGSNQNTTLPYSAANAPTTYSLAWSAAAAGNFATVSNAALSGTVSIAVPANTPPGVYTGFLTLANACGSSCTKPFTVTVNALPVVNAGTYTPLCVNSASVTLAGTPGGGTFTGTGVSGTSFTPPAAGSYTVGYSYTDAATGCANNASAVIKVSAPASSYTTACTSSTPYVFYGQPLTATGLHTVLINNANGCTDTARIYLVVKQTTVVDTSACDSMVYNRAVYYNDATLTQTVGSAVTACDSVVKVIRIRVNKRSTRDTTVCLPPNGSLTLLGQTFGAGGNYTLHTLNAAGCDSAVRLHLTVAATQPQVHTGCDSVSVNGQRFYASASFTDTLRNSTGCDSLIRTHNVVVYQTPHTYLNVCLPAGQTYSFNGQLLNASGTYTAVLKGAQCDSVVQLNLVAAATRQQSISGCSTVFYNGVFYTASAVLKDTLRSGNGCDSVYRVVNIMVLPLLQTFATACIKGGQSYNFNGQILTATGYYASTYQTAFCDSIVHLYLTVTATKAQTVEGCDTVVFGGKTYFASTVVQDTVRSLASACDSVITVTTITVHKKKHYYTSLCLKQGQTYNFNGQVLGNTGSYQTTYNTAYCDSIVHLYLVVSNVQSETITGCDTITYRGVVYTSPTVLADTVKSTVTQCDSLIQLLTITVNQRPAINSSRDTTVCFGGTATLSASSPNVLLLWVGFGNTNPITVSPQTKTRYTAVAADTNGCLNKVTVTVDVQFFSLLLSADKNPALSGTNVLLQTSGDLFYSMLSWQPAALFGNPTGRSQGLTIDTSITITAVAQTTIGCRDTATLQLVALPLNDVYIPSGFTPNGDGLNDEVHVMGTGIKELDFKIFNRWGQTVFSTTDKGKGWDGRIAGVLQPAGTYVYVVRVKKVNGQVMEKKGTVTLIR